MLFRRNQLTQLLHSGTVKQGSNASTVIPLEEALVIIKRLSQWWEIPNYNHMKTLEKISFKISYLI